VSCYKVYYVLILFIINNLPNLLTLSLLPRRTIKSKTFTPITTPDVLLCLYIFKYSHIPITVQVLEIMVLIILNFN